MTTIVITQPTYMPWIGYFHQLLTADIFVVLDSVQFVKRSWQCRNRIISREGSISYLTLAVKKTSRNCLIKDIEINDDFIVIQNTWDKYKCESKQYMNDMTDTLDSAVYGQDEAKNEIKRIIAQWINGEMKGYCFGFEGPPGTGKTSFAKKGLTRCLLDINDEPRPFSFIALGGSSNGATLEGHSYTYVGSTWGRIVDILMESNCLNPIIFIDELDKVSRTEHGKEIIGILTHLTDSTQNDEFNDKYFSGI